MTDSFLPSWLRTVTGATGPAGPTGAIGPQASGGIVRFLEWRSNLVGTMTPTQRLWLTTDVDSLADSARTTYNIIEPGFNGFARELQVYRYPVLGTPVPSPGPSGQSTNAGQFVYSVEQNGVVRATGIVPTMIAYRSFSLGISGAGTDQYSITVSTPSGTTWSEQAYTRALIRYSDT